ncbi:MAG: HD domain-containing phosphohydrolase [bacterium]
MEERIKRIKEIKRVDESTIKIIKAVTKSNNQKDIFLRRPLIFHLEELEEKILRLQSDEIVSILKDLVKDEKDNYLKYSIARTLREIATNEAMNLLIDMLKEPCLNLREIVINCLGDMKAGEAISSFIEILKDQNEIDGLKIEVGENFKKIDMAGIQKPQIKEIISLFHKEIGLNEEIIKNIVECLIKVCRQNLRGKEIIDEIISDKLQKGEIKEDKFFLLFPLAKEIPELLVTLLREEIFEAMHGYISKSFLIAMRIRDEYTSEHCKRVMEIIDLVLPEWNNLGKNMNTNLRKNYELDDVAKTNIKLAAEIHDIGKLSFTDELFDQNAFKDAAQRFGGGGYSVKAKGIDESVDPKKRLKQIMENHPSLTVEILENLNLPPNRVEILEIIKHHHERWDGEGYPDGLREREIPLGSRILAIADAFDAMAFSRPYRPHHLLFPAACDEMDKNKGTQFDPFIIEIFLQNEVREKLGRLYGKYTQQA